MVRTWLSILIPAAALAVVVLLLARLFPGVLDERGNRIELVYGLVLATVLVSSLLLRRSVRGSLNALLLWVAVGAALVLAYSFRYEAQGLGRRMLAVLVPSAAQGGGGEVVFHADRSGHFSLQGEVEGVEVRFLVDTGASDVVLSLQDARRVGIDPQQLRFNQPYRTANGIVMGASVRLDSVSVGDIVLEDVAASVNPTPMAQSLLGMSFLGRLSSYEITRDRLTLRQ